MRSSFFYALIAILSIGQLSGLSAQNRYYGENTIESANVQNNHKFSWVDSVYNAMSLDEKIGQLFMIAAYSGGENYNENAITQLIKTHHIGGLIFMQGTAEKQAVLTNKYQKLSKVPLLIGMDAEWGLGMRLTGVKNLPRQMMLGAAGQPELLVEMGKIVAEQCKRLGVHMNFAPTIDVNNNPNNPVINFRSFGENKGLVSKLGMSYMKGMQDNNVMACAKHFPGHGDVDVDSHLDLPIINKSKEHLDTMELYPFQQLIQAGVTSIMIGHLSIPALEPQENLPATLSYNIVTDLLRRKMGFKGLIITDALNMKGVTKYYQPGEVDYLAFDAGNDILLFSEDVPAAVSRIKKGINDGKISKDRLAFSVKKILMAKYNAGLNDVKVLETEKLTNLLNEPVIKFNTVAAEKSITILQDNNGLMFKVKDPNAKIAYYNSSSKENNFVKLLLSTFPKIKIIKDVDNIDQYDVVIVGIHDLSLYPGKNNNYNISDDLQEKLNSIAGKNNVLNIVFGNAYAARYVCDQSSVLITYEENEWTYAATMKVLSGLLKPTGKLPVTVCTPH